MKIVENRKKIFIGSAAVFILCLAIMLFNGFTGKGFFNLDVEFSGGLSILADIGADYNNDDIVQIVSDITGQNAPQVQRIQGTTQVAIKIKSLDTATRIELIDAISEKYGISSDSFEISDISSTVSGEMQKQAIMAVIVACIAMLIYISIRFRDVKTGGSTIITVLHDTIFVILIYGVFRIPVNNSFIVVLLTIIGYAVNNNIVVFDRLRENKKIMKRSELSELINKSINQSLRRCLFTSLTTIITVLCLYIFGVPSIKEFALPLIIGFLCGTYSSICFSGSVLYSISQKGAHQKNA